MYIMKNIFCIIVLILLFSSCDKKNQKNEIVKINVDLLEKDISIKDIFSRLEVVPLETTDSNLLIWPEKILIENGIIGIFDSKHPALFMFDADGNFLRKIGKKGEGPEEYREIYDVIIDSKSGNIQMLSPFGEIFSYAANGDFIKRIRLPQKATYETIEEFGDYYLTWSSPNSEEGGISVISSDCKEIVNEFIKEDSKLNSLYPRRFYSYAGKMFFFKPFYRDIYEVTKDSLILSYQWDFGKDNYDIATYGYTANPADRRTEGQKMLRELKDFTIPYIITMVDETDIFYYIKFNYGFTPEGTHHLFKMKNNNDTYFFKKTKEGINLHPLLFAEDYMACLVSTEELENYKKVLIKEESQKIENRLEDDNPCLIKFYYK